MMRGNPEKLNLVSSVNPTRMSQMLNKIIPRFLGSFILFSPFYPYGLTTIAGHGRHQNKGDNDIDHCVTVSLCHCGSYSRP